MRGLQSTYARNNRKAALLPSPALTVTAAFCTILPLRQCDCSFCAKHTLISDGRTRLLVAVRDPSALCKYEFGARTAEFHCCARCGVLVFVASVVAGHVYALLNAKTLDGADLFTVTPVDFDSEAVDGRLKHRSASWLPDFKIGSPKAAL